MVARTRQGRSSGPRIEQSTKLPVDTALSTGSGGQTCCGPGRPCCRSRPTRVSQLVGVNGLPQAPQVIGATARMLGATRMRRLQVQRATSDFFADAALSSSSSPAPAGAPLSLPPVLVGLWGVFGVAVDGRARRPMPRPRWRTWRPLLLVGGSWSSRSPGPRGRRGRPQRPVPGSAGCGSGLGVRCPGRRGRGPGRGSPRAARWPERRRRPGRGLRRRRRSRGAGRRRGPSASRRSARAGPPPAASRRFRRPAPRRRRVGRDGGPGWRSRWLREPRPRAPTMPGVCSRGSRRGPGCSGSWWAPGVGGGLGAGRSPWGLPALRLVTGVVGARGQGP